MHIKIVPESLITLVGLNLFAVLAVGCQGDEHKATQVPITIHPCITEPYCIYDEATGSAACEDGYVREEPDNEMNFACVSCALVTCEDLEAQCGLMSDGCGSMLDCGQCLENEECGIETPNQCTDTSCEASDCTSANAECGTIDDGCGRMLDCGACEGTSCGVVAPNRCGAVELGEFEHLHKRKMMGSSATFCNLFEGNLFLCWGNNEEGLARDMNRRGHIVDTKDDCFLDISGQVQCMMRSGFRVNWVTVPGGPYKQVVGKVSENNTYFFLTTDGTWAGYSYSRQSGFSEATDTPVPSGAGFLMGIANGKVTCSLTAAGGIECASIDPGDIDPAGLVSGIPEDGPYVQIRGDGASICAVSIEGELRCWGDLPDPSAWSAEVTEFFRDRYSAIDVHDQWICGLTQAGGRSHCLTQGAAGLIVEPVHQTTFGPEFTEIYITSLRVGSGTCARTREGFLKCNPSGAAGLVQGRFQHLGMSDELICGVDEAGQIRCNDGGDDFVEFILQPINRVGPHQKVSVWRPNGNGNPKTNVCALNPSGRLSCFDAHGRDPSYVVNAHSTLRHVELSDFVMGQASGCGLTPEGGIRCVGWDTFGQVTNAPGQIGFVTLTAGAQSYCATKADGVAYCWGENYSSFEDRLRYIALSPEQTGSVIGLSLQGRILAYALNDRFGGFQEAISSFRPQNTVSLAANLNTICALDSANHMSCTNSSGLEISGLDDMQDTTFEQMFVDQDSTVCGLTTEGKIACVGHYFLPLNDLSRSP
jgi:hypothetical protein